MSYSPKVAILMAVYNGSEYIDEQIASILSQQYVDLTVFISIDRSVDDSYLKCRGWAESDPRIILLKYGERFGSAGRNFFHLINSVSLDDFDYVAFSDQDDIWLPGKLARGISLMKSCSYDAYSSNVIAFWPSNRVKLIDKAQEELSLISGQRAVKTKAKNAIAAFKVFSSSPSAKTTLFCVFLI